MYGCWCVCVFRHMCVHFSNVFVFPQAKTLAVSNSDSTTDVIQMALQQFGILGCVKDHQLWVSSIKDDSPYPLIGEFNSFTPQPYYAHLKPSHIALV